MKDKLFNLLNYYYYGYRRNNWMLDFSRHWKDFEQVKIDKPVFLLGVHGGGLTVISRMIRRHKDFVSVSGNCDYWAGAGEMAVVLGPVLPEELTGINHKIPQESGLEKATHWLYATEKYLPYFRKQAEDVIPEVRKKFRKIIRWQIKRHAINKNKARFTDKSQIYSVKVSFINEILKGSNPKFISIVRNPYVMAYRTADKIPAAYRKNNIALDSFNKRLKLAAEHWKNSVKCPLEDSEEAEVLTIKLEEFLRNPEEKFKEICDFIEIEFKKNLMPQSDQELPLGTRGRYKWYPLKQDVNQPYLKEIIEEHGEIVHKITGDYAEKFNYEKP